jgi:hypothetical protein
LASFGNLEAAGDNRAAAFLLFNVSRQIELLGKAGPDATTGEP